MQSSLLFTIYDVILLKFAYILRNEFAQFAQFAFLGKVKLNPKSKSNSIYKLLYVCNFKLTEVLTCLNNFAQFFLNMHNFSLNYADGMQNS